MVPGLFVAALAIEQRAKLRPAIVQHVSMGWLVCLTQAGGISGHFPGA